MELHQRQRTWDGFGDGFSKAVEMVLTPFLCAAIGWGIDRLLGTGPVFLVAFAAFGVVGTAVKTYYQYKSDMDRAEEGKPWAKPKPH